MIGQLDASSKLAVFSPYDQTVWEPQASRQTRKLDLDSPPPTCLWNPQSPEDPLALSDMTQLQ